MHHWVFADEVENGIRKLTGVLNTRSWSGFGHTGRLHGQPHRRAGGLFLKLAIKDLLDVFQVKGAYGRSVQAVLVGAEDGVEHRVIVRRFEDVLNFVEKEGKVSGE